MERLTKDSQFALAREHGEFKVNKLLVMRALPNDLGVARYGFIASRRVGNAVVRNRIRRLLREVVRTVSINGGWDIVVIARKGAADASYHDIKEALDDLLKRMHLIGGLDRG